MAGQVKVVALYDTVGFKPQMALDGADPAIRRITEYFDKGEVREIPQSEFDRLTDKSKFPDGPAVAKVGSSAASVEAPAPAGAVAPEDSGTPNEPHSVPGGSVEGALQGDELVAALDGLNVRTLSKLASDNGVTVGGKGNKPDFVAALAAAGVQPPE